MICPIKSAVVAVQVRPGEKQMEDHERRDAIDAVKCLGEGCSWWSPAIERCGIAGLAR